MKSLVTLIKLQKNRVDEQRLVVAKMQEQLADVIARIERLELEMESQRKLIHMDSSFALTYGEYIKRALMQREGFERRRRAAEYAVKLSLDKLAELFEEQKRYEIAQQNRIEEQHRLEQHRETIMLDEVGSVGFIRKKKREGLL